LRITPIHFTHRARDNCAFLRPAGAVSNSNFNGPWAAHLSRALYTSPKWTQCTYKKSLWNWKPHRKFPDALSTLLKLTWHLHTITGLVRWTKLKFQNTSLPIVAHKKSRNRGKLNFWLVSLQQPLAAHAESMKNNPKVSKKSRKWESQKSRSRQRANNFKKCNLQRRDGDEGTVSAFYITIS